MFRACALPGVRMTTALNVWKHYFVIAAPIWRDDLLDLCQPKSGVVTIELDGHGGLVNLDVKRRPAANRADTPLGPEVVVDIARLASLRMWDAYRESGPRREGGVDA